MCRVLSQRRDLGKDSGGEDCLQEKEVFNRGLVEFIGTFLHLLLTPCILGKSITIVQFKLDSASNFSRPRT